jgi:hypothetical protein
MRKKASGKATANPGPVEESVEREPRSAAMAARGIETGTDFAGLMSALMTDVLGGKVSPMVCNAACNAAGKLLKVVEMQHRYGTPSSSHGAKELVLCDSSSDSKAIKIAKLESDLAELKQA